MNKFILSISLIIIFIASSLNVFAEDISNVKYIINEYKTPQSLGCPENTPISFQNYLRTMYQKIESYAKIPLKDAYGKIGVSFYLDKNGNTRNIQIMKSSGDINSDNLAIMAIQNAGPFGPFPSEYQLPEINLNYLFYLKPIKNITNTIPSNPYLPQTNISTNTTNYESYNIPGNPYLPQTNTNNIMVPAKSSSTNYVPQATTSNNIPSNPYITNIAPITNNQNFVVPGLNQNKLNTNTYNKASNSQSTGINTNFNNFNQNFSYLTQSSGLNMIKDPKNPMKYNYNAEAGNYFNTIHNFITEEGILVKDYHFQNFPIKYWVQATPDNINSIIRNSINDYAYYLPMIETNNRFDADITIELTQMNTGDYRTMGFAGLEYPTIKGSVSLSPSIFNKDFIILAKLIVKHEIAHALGIIKHSDDINDMMFPMQRIDPLPGGNKAKVMATGQIKTFEEFGRFSYRDLNTLWILYNQWW